MTADIDMTKSALTLTDLTTKPYAWFRTNEPHVYGLQTEGQSLQYLTTTQLAELDSRLPELLSYLLEAAVTKSATLTERILATISLWAHPHPVLKEVNKDNIETYIVQARMATITPWDSESITVNAVIVSAENINGMKIAVKPKESSIIEMSQKWMEKHYPNSGERLNTGLALGMKANELADYVFNHIDKPINSVNLPHEM